MKKHFSQTLKTMNKITLKISRYHRILILLFLLLISNVNAYKIEIFQLNQNQYSWLNDNVDVTKGVHFFNRLKAKYTAKFVRNGLSESEAQAQAAKSIKEIRKTMNMLIDEHKKANSIDSELIANFKDELLPMVEGRDKNIVKSLQAFSIKDYDGIAFGLERNSERPVATSLGVGTTSGLLQFAEDKNFYTYTNFISQTEGANISDLMYTGRAWEEDIFNKLLNHAVANDKIIAFRLDGFDANFALDEFDKFATGAGTSVTNLEFFTLISRKDVVRRLRYYISGQPASRNTVKEMQSLIRKIELKKEQFKAYNQSLQPMPTEEESGCSRICKCTIL